jgi:hypothetical protein
MHASRIPDAKSFIKFDLLELLLVEQEVGETTSPRNARVLSKLLTVITVPQVLGRS